MTLLGVIEKVAMVAIVTIGATKVGTFLGNVLTEEVKEDIDYYCVNGGEKWYQDYPEYQVKKVSFLKKKFIVTRNTFIRNEIITRNA